MLTESESEIELSFLNVVLSTNQKCAFRNSGFTSVSFMFFVLVRYVMFPSSVPSTDDGIDFVGIQELDNRVSLKMDFILIKYYFQYSVFYLKSFSS